MATRKEIVRSVIDGIVNAQKKYVRMSGDTSVQQGAEYWITTHVAFSLWKLLGDGTVTIEEQSEAAFYYSQKQLGAPYKASKRKRFDILLWSKKSIPLAPIEIKTHGPIAEILKDVEKLVAALKQANMKFAVVGYYYSRSSGKRDSAIELVER